MSNDVTARVESFLADIKSIGIARQQHGMAFSAIDDAMLSAAFAANTPGIGYWSLWPEVDAGKPTYIEFGIYNTTNQYWHSVNLSLFFGPTHFIADVGLAIAGRDNRWPHISARTELLATAIHTNVRFDYTVPADILPATYFGNVVLWRYEQLWDRNFYYQSVRK